MPGRAYTGAMNERVKHLAEQARQLTHAEQADLFDLLLLMMHEGPPALGTDWEEEIERRLAEIDRGEATMQDFDEAMRALHAKL